MGVRQVNSLLVAAVLLVCGAGLAACGNAPRTRVVSQDISEFPYADGVVLSVIAETGEAIINLGVKDRVRVGLKFHVFDRRVPPSIGGIRPSLNTQDSVAALEVIEVGESQSVCRITGMRANSRFEPGSLIANLVYRGMRMHPPVFVVIGGFDLNGDGAATAAERERVVRMIAAYGGKVQQDLSAHTDYLVAGVRPLAPVIPSPPVDDGPGTTPHQRQLDHEAYDQVLTRAQTRLFVPVLNTHRFLELMDPPTSMLSDR